MNWLIKILIDNGWVRFGLSFRWIFGTKKILTALVNESDLNVIESRYKLIEQSGFFSGEEGALNQQAFIQALFAYDAFKGDAFSKALGFSYSWNGGSAAPLAAFLSFIHRVFFQGPSAESNKQTFIEAVSKQHNGKSNALARAAKVKNPTPQDDSNPLTMVLNSLTGAGCFTGPRAAENKQRVINSIFMPDNKGENALYNALKSRDILKPENEDSYPNIKVLLDTLANADCFNGLSAESNKDAFIRAVLVTAEYGGVLHEAMWDHNTLQQILTALTNAGCFATESKRQAFVDALVTPDSLGRNPLYHAAHISQSLKLIYEQLKQTGCLNSEENEQKLIKAFFAQDQKGASALLNASETEECSTLILDILTESGCFDGSRKSGINQQLFVNAVFAEDKYGITCLYNSLSDNQMLNQLMKIKYLEGFFAEKNKRAFIRTVFAPIKIGDQKQGSAFSRNCTYDSFPLLLDHLTAAGCFSGSPRNPNKQAFLNAVFAKDKHDESLLSVIYRTDSIILLLKKLEEAGCFDNAEDKMKFRQTVRADGNALLFNVIRRDFRGYLALHKSLLLSGFSAQDIKELLNEPIKQKNDSWAVATPLMMALRGKNDLLAARLIADGAVLTEQQKQQVEQVVVTNKWQKAEQKVVPFDRAAIKQKLTQPEQSGLFNKPKLKRSVSLSNLSLFAEKQSDASSKYAANDTALIRNNAPR